MENRKHPEAIGPYVVKECLGSGVQAIVYRASQPALDRDVAIKVLRPAMAADPEFLSRFEQEARAIARLRHPGIVQVYDAGQTDEGLPYVVMSYVGGGTLADRIKGDRDLLPDEIHQVISQIADALDHAHGKGLVHRDVKPANILIDPDGHFLLTDFGVAKLLQGDPGDTAPGNTLGTPSYMSPEQCLGGREIDGRADLYSLGVILYELVVGQLPFQGDTPSAVAIQQIQAEPRFPADRVDSIPEPLRSLILKSLEKDPAARFQSGAAFISALEKAQTVASLAAVPPAQPPADAAPKPVAAATSAAAKRTGRGKLLLVLVPLALLVVVGIYLNGRAEGDSEPPAPPPKPRPAGSEPAPAKPEPMKVSRLFPSAVEDLSVEVAPTDDWVPALDLGITWDDTIRGVEARYVPRSVDSYVKGTLMRGLREAGFEARRMADQGIPAGAFEESAQWYELATQLGRDVCLVLSYEPLDAGRKRGRQGSTWKPTFLLKAHIISRRNGKVGQEGLIATTEVEFTPSERQESAQEGVEAAFEEMRGDFVEQVVRNVQAWQAELQGWGRRCQVVVVGRFPEEDAAEHNQSLREFVTRLVASAGGRSADPGSPYGAKLEPDQPGDPVVLLSGLSPEEIRIPVASTDAAHLWDFYYRGSLEGLERALQADMDRALQGGEYKVKSRLQDDVIVLEVGS